MKSSLKYIAICFIIFVAMLSLTAFAENDATVLADGIDFALKSGDNVITFENSVYTGFSVDNEKTKLVNGSEYTIPEGKQVLLFNKDYSKTALYQVTENGFEHLDYYIIYKDMSYGSFALEESLSSKANIYIAFYQSTGRINKVITGTSLSDGRVYFETSDVSDAIYAKAFRFDTNTVLKPIAEAKKLELYAVISSAETDEDGDTIIDVDDLLNGNGDIPFQPDEIVTIAGAVTLASQTHAKYYNKTIPSAEYGYEWYTPYFDFAIENGLIEEGQFENPNETAKRHELASLLCNALPDSCFTKINDVKRIIDVSENAPYAEDILTLYNAGVLAGSDAYGSFKPESSITWAEAKAVAERITHPETRLETDFSEYSHYDAYLLDQTSSYNGSKLPMASSWVLDGRGGAPKASRGDSNAIMVDIAEDAGTAYIREFNKFSTGRVVLDTSVDIIGEGAYLEYRNADDKPIYHLENTNDAWVLLDKDGSLNKVYDMGGKTKFAFRIIIDLDNALCTTYIDGNDCGTYPLCVDKEDANILNFRFATTDEGTPVVTPGKTFATVNYAVYEGFDSAPFYFTLSEGAARNTQNSSLNLAGNASAAVSFIPTGVKIAAEFAMFLPKNESVCYTLYDGENAVAEFTTDTDNFYLNGEKVYESYYGNLWYRLRFELDSDTQKIRFKVNGNDAAVVPFKNAATSVDNLKVENLSDTQIQIDTVKVFRMIEHDDYVPAPVRPKGEEKYTVGINVCSLWQEGSHYGWGIISGFDDREPVLGYYDEGSPETADWEIKYLVEHGVDFEALCWYPDTSNKPIKDPKYSAQLYDGIKNAKYSNEIKYCIIWEMENSNVPASIDDWKNHYVPYMIEYFFKDPRYMRVNNKALLATFGQDALKSVLGEDGVKEAMDYLGEELKKIGYDGVYYIGRGTGEITESFGKSGVDGVYSYNWGTGSYSPTLNKSMNLLWAQNEYGIDVIPTIAVAFNEAPWAGKRYPIMSKSDNLSVHTWMRDEFMPANAKQPETENLVWLATWNEYGEGTYMMPVTDPEIGFRYLDVIREVYTDEGEDSSINIVPTAEQRERINHLYPQYRKVLTREYYDVSFEYESLLSNTVTVDGKTFDMTLSPYKTKEGVVLFPFDPVTTVIDSRLGMFYLWDRDKKELTLQTKDHTVIFTAGSTTAVFDGEEKELASPVELIDSIPAIPIEELCEYVGYEFNINENSAIEIITPRKAQVDAEIAAREPGKWEFNTIHDNEGWTSYNLSLNTSAGLLRGAVAGTDENRHMINYGPLNIDLSDYSGVEVRIKYRYTADNPTTMCIYFTTEADQTWGEDKNKYVTHTSTDSGDKFAVYTFDFSKHEKWNGTLRGLRFNSFYAKSGTFEIDYIRLIPRETDIYVGDILKQ